MGTQPVTETEFNVLHFEKQLTSLKDSQDCINTCCQWCLQNRVHHKKIVNSWLNVLKRVKVEQRLILFYLANDVVQYSKRRNYEYVESWGTAIQKATTMVRDDRVKHKILRIFKIWEQRGVYNEEFISDLCGLLSVVPSGPKSDEPHEFQPNYVVNKIKTCANLENDTDIKLKVLKEHNPKIHIDDGLIASLKDRAHMDDVEKEVDVYVMHMENYINALKLEIKNRITLITVLKQAETQLEADRKDVKIVANAYKMFGTRVKTFQKKLDEHKSTLSSPIPSPDINAPSPSPDSDIELPEGDTTITTPPKEVLTEYDPKVELQQYTNAGYYTPVVPITNSTSSFINGFSSFIGSDLSFNLENLNSTILSSSSDSQKVSENTQPPNSYSTTAPPVINNPPLPVEAPSVATSNYSYNTEHLPLLPPPMPPFSKSETEYGNANYNQSYTANTPTTVYDGIYTPTTATSEILTTNYKISESTDIPNFLEESFEPPLGANPYPPTEEYNPEQDIGTWKSDAVWNKMHKTDTPESPPLFEKEGYSDPIEYHDNLISSGAVDVDQRVLPGIEGDLEDSLSSLGGKDVDHRNLISLTGSPGTSINPMDENIWTHTDQDYRTSLGLSTTGDQDYRTTNFNIEQLKLPPPPPPSPKLGRLSSNTLLPSHLNSVMGKPSSLGSVSKSPRKIDNTDSIDMDLSDDDVENKLQQKHNDNLKVIVDNSKDEQLFSLEPPPPLPDLPDDVDANNFLDDLSNDLHEFSNLSDELSNSNLPTHEVGTLTQSTLIPPPLMNFNEFINPQVNTLMDHHMNPTMNTPMNPMNSPLHSSVNPLINPPPVPPEIQRPQHNNWLYKEPISNWPNEDEPNPWLDNAPDEEKHLNWMPHDLEITQSDWLPDQQNNWQQNNVNVGYRGRGHNRGNFNKNFNQNRGRGRPANFNRGNVFRGGRGNMRPNRGHRSRGNFRGNFRGGF